jgi:DNA polymerase-3 subunit delta
MLIDWLGEDVARLGGIAGTLKSTYGSQKITREKLEPFLGERGDVKPWDLTDAIDGGNATKALMASRRMMTAGERHPLQIMAQLHNHYSRLAKLDGPDVSSIAEAEAVLGLKGFSAEKALKAYRNLTGAGVRRAFELLAAADLDLRGSTGLDEEVVMDVLVARLAKLTGSVSRQR